jgi:hypothetical protein
MDRGGPILPRLAGGQGLRLRLPLLKVASFGSFNPWIRKRPDGSGGPCWDEALAHGGRDAVPAVIHSPEPAHARHCRQQTRGRRPPLLWTWSCLGRPNGGMPVVVPSTREGVLIYDPTTLDTPGATALPELALSPSDPRQEKTPHQDSSVTPRKALQEHQHVTRQAEAPSVEAAAARRE